MLIDGSFDNKDVQVGGNANAPVHENMIVTAEQPNETNAVVTETGDKKPGPVPKHCM